jgi:hypothetical protein
MPRAASARLALRVRSWMGVSTGLRGASPRTNGVAGCGRPDNAHDLLHQIGLASTSARHDGR